MMDLKKFEDIIIMSFRNCNSVSPHEIREAATKFAPIFSVSEKDMEPVIRNVESKLVITMSQGISLVDQDADHDDEWYRTREIEWNYWKDYELYLTGWSPRVINTLENVTEKILGLLKDPQEASDWDRRGLVIGHVQSGKTANYIGLVCKAADAGYKFIIVIAGIHNNLRKQTQHRIDEGFVGRSSTPDKKRKAVGVGNLIPNREYPVSLTTTNSDFNSRIASQLGADLSGFSQPVVVVIKKNVRTLKNLYNWLRELNLRDSADQIADIPMLMIDDEADYASINTKKTDIDPTRTNEEIRSILKLFKKSCYVGYTATPFANIFINPDSSAEMLGDDLFPRDFIYCLDVPTNYFGPSKVFLDEEYGDKILCTINDAEDYIPFFHKKTWEIGDLPPSMKQAINSFVIGKAVRILRGQENEHCSMMINASRFVNVQKQIKEHVSYYIKNMCRAVKFSYKLLDEKAIKCKHLADLKKTYDEKFSNISEQWSDVQKQLAEVADSIRIFLINSQSEESLDYNYYKEKGESLTVIAVGGLSLSRGLTLEGLIVSYMYRNTRMYDTLMQMGRWFGYRGSFDSICRIWLTDESQGWYRHIAEATEELRQQIKQMQRDRLTPRDFGFYVRTHPDALHVTARNKMRTGTKIKLDINFAGRLRETVIVPYDEQITEENRKMISDLFEELKKNHPEKLEERAGSYFWKDVSYKNVEEFLMKFRFHEYLIGERNAVLEYLRKIAEKYPNVDVAFISLSKIKKSDYSYVQLDEKRKMFCQKRSVGTDNQGERKIPDDGLWVTNDRRVASRGAEDIGLTDEQVRKAEEDKSKAEAGNNISDHFYRKVRSKPLLMIHFLTLAYKNRGKDKESEILLDKVPAASISFPYNFRKEDHLESVECVVNKVWLEQDMFDDPDDEDDYDS